MFSYVDLEERVPAKHPLRVIKAIVEDALRERPLPNSMACFYSAKLTRNFSAFDKFINCDLEYTKPQSSVRYMCCR